MGEDMGRGRYGRVYYMRMAHQSYSSIQDSRINSNINTTTDTLIVWIQPFSSSPLTNAPTYAQSPSAPRERIGKELRPPFSCAAVRSKSATFRITKSSIPPPAPPPPPPPPTPPPVVVPTDGVRRASDKAASTAQCNEQDRRRRDAQRLGASKKAMKYLRGK